MVEMEFGRTFSKRSGEAITTALVEGGGVALGLVASGTIGKMVEKTVKKGVTKDSKTMDKIVAYFSNNLPKVGLYVILKKIGPIDPQSPGNMTELMLVDAKKATIASVALDSLIRIGNRGAPGNLKVFNLDILGEDKIVNVTDPGIQDNIQKLIQENSTLRSQLNQSLSKLASVQQSTPALQQVVAASQSTTPQSATRIITNQPHPDHDRRFGMMSATATVGEPEDRRKKYGAMEAPLIEERNRRFSQMNNMRKLNFAEDETKIASIFGMQ